ncbi:MAG: hypothetical protein J7497_13015, partial [Chitinophagaceae bacterium]|nr:hypothetical protein [Chitinophagaceae bacterium]
TLCLPNPKPMQIAITDACIFIDIYELQLNASFFELEIIVHTSIDVFNELYPEQQKVLKIYQASGKLFLHTISAEDRSIIFKEKYPKSLSQTDKTVLHLAVKLNAMILSSDASVRNYAKKNSIEYHGMLWVLDQLVDQKLLSGQEATKRLDKLIKTNIVYQNNIHLVEEMGKRKKKWS